MEGEGERGWLARVREFECTALGALQVCVFCESRAVSERESAEAVREGDTPASATSCRQVAANSSRNRKHCGRRSCSDRLYSPAE